MFHSGIYKCGCCSLITGTFLPGWKLCYKQLEDWQWLPQGKADGCRLLKTVGFEPWRPQLMATLLSTPDSVHCSRYIFCSVNEFLYQIKSLASFCSNFAAWFSCVRWRQWFRHRSRWGWCGESSCSRCWEGRRGETDCLGEADVSALSTGIFVSRYTRKAPTALRPTQGNKTVDHFIQFF